MNRRDTIRQGTHEECMGNLCVSLCRRDSVVQKSSKNKKPPKKEGFCAVEQIRTAMLFTALPPQSSASTNFATTASELQI